jgi:transcriptional regulator with XRE-family HTH domain
MTLSDWLELQRISDVAFARTLGVAQSTVLRLRRGHRRPSLALAEKIDAITKGAVTPNDWRVASSAGESAA